ncbi:MAG TPA: dTDP-4-dehydrorhamnose reductase [Epulopiscium sp.]|nr:dTDP-4-dehydrorhamnose reductase [Candidatus Epulonipiscium sp.]
MKIVITGSKGQLGSQLIQIIKQGKSELGTISKAYEQAKVIGIDIDELDITNINEVRKFMTLERPDIIINPAAYTNVDACETEEDTAYKINAIGARNIAIAAEEIGAKLMHISTDYVFEGNGTSPYKEYDRVAPVTVYGKTKLAGEEFVKVFCKKYFILRTSWLYGYNGHNFVKIILKLAREKEEIDVVDDQRGNPTNAEDVAHHILKIALTEEYGLYHCTGIGECSWYDFATKIVAYAGLPCTVKPTTSDKFVRPAKRPAFSALDNMMLRLRGEDEMRNWEEALEQYINIIK